MRPRPARAAAAVTGVLLCAALAVCKTETKLPDNPNWKSDVEHAMAEKPGLDDSTILRVEM